MARALALLALAAVLLGSPAPSRADTLEQPLAFLDGSNGASYGPAPALALQTFGTIEFWVSAGWTSDPGFDPTILAHQGDAGTLYSVHIRGDRRGIGYWDGANYVVAPFDFSDGDLHYVAIVTEDMLTTIWVDGDPLALAVVGYGVGESTGFHLGSLDGTQSPFYGRVAGLRLWSVALEGPVLNAYAFTDLLEHDGAGHPAAASLVGAVDFRDNGRTLNLRTW
jgi:hypothetical protein